MSTSAANVKPRTIDSSPFCWCHKPALRRIREALDDAPYLDQALAVYLCHCECASDQQSPSYTVTRRKIAERAGVSIRQVAEIQGRLRAMKLLDWQQNRIDGANELSASTYTLLGLGTARPTLGTPHTRLGTGAKTPPCTVVEESIEESIEEFPEQSVLEEIYKAYPKKVGKPTALNAIRKALKGCPAQTLLERTKAYATARAGNLEFTPHPATWFNQERFNDDPRTWAKSQASEPKPSPKEEF